MSVAQFGFYVFSLVTTSAWVAQGHIATTAFSGLLSGGDKVKLDGISSGAAALTANAPTAISVVAAAVGVGTAAARDDHVHSVVTGTPVAVLPGATNSAGSATSLARSDHVHQLPAFGSTAGTITQGNDARLSDDRTASGLRTATTVVSVSGAAAPTAAQVLTATSSTAATWQSLPTIPALSSTAPSTVSNVAAAVGVGTTSARADHVHAVSSAAPVALTLAGTNSAGTATTLTLSDHVHALPATAAPANLTVGAANAAGVSTSLVRADHVHGMPALATGAVDGFL
jgi:hypothetical protein